MKKSYLLFIILLLPTIVACSNNSITDSGVNVSTTTLEDFSVEEGFIQAIFRQDFYLNDHYYVMNVGSSFTIDDKHKLIGYFVNEKDLEHWTIFDNDINLMYAIDENNNLIHNDASDFKNRFALYKTDGSTDIGLRIRYTLYIYERKF